MKKKVDSFKLGDQVTWESGSQGTYTEKVGTVVAVVRPGDDPPFVRFIDSHSYTIGGGWNRTHRSYLISVPSPADSKAQPRLYWPRVSGLRLACPALPGNLPIKLSGEPELVCPKCGEPWNLWKQRLELVREAYLVEADGKLSKTDAVERIVFEPSDDITFAWYCSECEHQFDEDEVKT